MVTTPGDSLGPGDRPPSGVYEGDDWAKRKTIVATIDAERRKRARGRYEWMVHGPLPPLPAGDMTERAKSVVFKGVTFRSTIEARWATFMSLMGVDYEYEPDRYNVGLAEGYVPDFWLPAQRCFLEIKHHAHGTPPTAEECRYARALAQTTKSWVFVFFGPLSKAQLSKGSAYAFSPVADGRTRMQWWWARCPACRSVDITERGSTKGQRCGCVLPAGDARTHDDPWVLERLKTSAASLFTSA